VVFFAVKLWDTEAAGEQTGPLLEVRHLAGEGRVGASRSMPNARPSGRYLRSGRLIVRDGASRRSMDSSNGRRSEVRGEIAVCHRHA
jgi:hypothetical protein